MLGYMKVLAALSIGVLGAPLGNAKPVSAAEQGPVTAIDILLEPDETMIEKVMAANQRLLKTFPEGFALDETHTPHISVLQRYVKTADLDKMYEAVGRVLAGERARCMRSGWPCPQRSAGRRHASTLSSDSPDKLNVT
jgi:hypothetical protein